jgi:hypothetical protein
MIRETPTLLGGGGEVYSPDASHRSKSKS